jgi:DNA-binding NarL/FixJ family response regulator
MGRREYCLARLPISRFPTPHGRQESIEKYAICVIREGRISDMLVSSRSVGRVLLLPRHTRKGDMEGGSIHRLPGFGAEARTSVGIDARSDAAPARLLIADDHALLRTGMRAMLEAEPDLEVVGEARNGREAVDLCRELLPDLVLMDLSMPEMGGIEATRAIKVELPRTGVLVLTAHADQEMLFEAIRAGAAGYVLKGVGPDELVGLVRGTLGGESPVDQELVMGLVRRLAQEADPPGGIPEPSATDQGEPESLTSRELGVLRLLTEGRTNRQIAHDLHLSLSTVKRHLERIISKLGVSDRTQAAVKAVDLGLIDPDRAG